VLEPLSLSVAEQKELRRQARRAVGRVSERIHYVLLFVRSYDAEEIAALYQVDPRTVESWIERFRQGGVGALDDLPRNGRPRAASVAARVEATQCLETTPARSGSLRTTWTQRLLGQHLAERVGCWLSRRSVGG
jgi:transposase